MSNLITGLLGYTMKKEYLGDSLFFRTTQSFDYEIWSTDFDSWSPTTVQSAITDEFRNRYSGDIFVKVFQVSTEPASINEFQRSQKFRVSIDVRTSHSGIFQGQSEINSTYYTGLDVSFWTGWGQPLNDFKEDFGFEKNENGNSVFSHDISFQLLTGNRIAALRLASGIFAQDKNTTFGIALPGLAPIGDTTQYSDYFTEVSDQIRQNYRFSKRREILPFSGTNGLFDMQHTLDIKDDGTTDILERCSLKGKLSFQQSRLLLDSNLAASYNRCNTFYSTYMSLAGGTTMSLINFPVKTLKSYNPLSLGCYYDVSFTNDPKWSNGTSTEETYDLESDENNIITLRHKFNFTSNKRSATQNFITLINNATGISPSRVNAYYSNAGSLYTASRPLKLVKQEATWPVRNNKASVLLEYTNNPKQFVTVNGVLFNFVDFKVNHSKPVDIINEYKIINRPSKSSIINYAYQTEKGQITVTVEGGLGRDPDEFMTHFRDDYSNALIALYKYGIGIFMNHFYNAIPTAFTYYLSDMKYSMNQDGVLGIVLTFVYTLKKYTA